MWYKWWQEWKKYEEKESECIDYTYPDDTEKGVNDIDENRNEKYYEEKEEGETTDYYSTTID